MINRGRSAAAARDQAPLRPSGLRPSGKPPAAGATGALVGQPATSRARVVAGKTGTGVVCMSLPFCSASFSLAESVALIAQGPPERTPTG